MNNQHNRSEQLRQMFDNREIWDPIEYKNELIAKYRKLSGNQQPAPSIMTMEDWLIKYMADFVPIPKFKPGTGMIQETGPEKIAWWNEPDPAKRFEMKVPHFDAGRFGYCPELNAGIIQPKCDKDPDNNTMDTCRYFAGYDFTPGAKNTLDSLDPDDMQAAFRELAALKTIPKSESATAKEIDKADMQAAMQDHYIQMKDDIIRLTAGTWNTEPTRLQRLIRKFKNICRDLWNTIKPKKDETKTATDHLDDIDRAFFHDKL